jgi:hypothetical protein
MADASTVLQLEALADELLQHFAPRAARGSQVEFVSIAAPDTGNGTVVMRPG